MSSQTSTERPDRKTVERHRSAPLRVVGLAFALLLAACSAGQDVGTPGGPAVPSATAVPNSSRATGSAPTTPAPLPAIEQVSLDIGREGVTKDRALLLFSLTVGPLPGVTIPPGERGTVEETTMPILYLSSVWDELSDEQRREAARLLEWDDEAAPRGTGSAEVLGSRDGTSRSPRGSAPVGTTPATAPGSTAPGSTAIAGAGANFVPAAARLSGAAAPTPVVTDSNGDVVDADYLAGLGGIEMNALAGFVGSTIPGFTVTTFDDRRLGEVHAETSNWHFSLAAGGQVPYPKGLCNIDAFLPNFQGQTPTVNRSIMAHEVFHCFQFTALGSVTAAASTGKWLMEGGAMWAQLQALPLARGEFFKTDRAWDLYSLHPETHLYDRSYDAVGFLGHVGDVRGGQASLWPLLLPATVAGQGRQDDAAFDALVAGAEREVFESWGASYFRFTDRAGWTMTGPGGVDGARVSPTRSSVGAGSNVVLDGAKPWEIEMNELDASVDIVKITTINGYVRLLDGAHQRQVSFTPHSDVTFCLKGTCTCPPGSSGFDEQTISVKAPLSIGLTGGRTSAAGYAQGFNLEDFCKNPQRKPPAMPGGTGNGGGGGSDPGNPGGPGTGTGGRSKGDPHITTLDEHSFGFQAVGEYVLARSTSDRFEVQVRQEPFTGRRDVSVNTAVATRVGDDRVTVTLEDGRLIARVDGEVSDEDFRRLDGGSMRRATTSTGTGVAVEWEDGTLLEALPIGPYGINVHLVPSEDRRARLEGLLGNFDGNPDNDLVTSTGDRVDQFSRAELYERYRPSWMIDGDRSLFDYKAGERSSDFADDSFPDQLVDPRDIPGRAEAEQSCRAAGIVDPTLLEECTVDLALTGQSAFLKGYATISRTIAAEGGGVTGTEVVIEGEVTDRAQQPEHRFDANEGDVLGARLEGCDDASMPMRLTAPDNTEVMTATGCLLTRIEIPRTGTYTLAVNIFGEKSGRYRVVLEPVRSDRTADVRFGDELRGTIDQRAAHDAYRLDARAGDVLSVSPPDCEDHQLSLTVTDPDGAAISVTTACQTPQVALTKDGTYILTVNDNNTATGAYRLPLRKR